MDVQRGEVLSEREVTELALEAAVRRDVAHRHQAECLSLILNNPYKDRYATFAQLRPPICIFEQKYSIKFTQPP